MVHRPLALVVASLAVACGREPGVDVYTPFDAERLVTTQDHVAAHGTIATRRKDATLENHVAIYAEMQAAYDADGLSAAVADLEDRHLDVEGWGLADAGTFLDTQIRDALAMGASATAPEHLDWAGQTADKGLLVYFALATYAGLAERTRPHLDGAYGLTGLDVEGEPVGGLATVAAGREDEFGVSLLRPQFTALLDAHVALAEATDGDDDVLGTHAGFDTAHAAVDETLVQTLGLYLVHELDELTAENADVKVIEARVAWEGIAAYAEATSPDQAAIVWAGLYPSGVPARDAEGYFWSGLADIRSGAVLIDVAPMRAAMVILLDDAR